MNSEALAALRSGLKGAAFVPGDDGYAEAMVILNGTIGVGCNWDDPAADEAGFRFEREAIEELQPFFTGVPYMNFVDPDDASATAASYGDGLQRLVAVKQKYDPANLFRSRRGLGG